MIKKNLAILLILAVIISSFAGCTNEGIDTEESTVVETDTATVDTADDTMSDDQPPGGDIGAMGAPPDGGSNAETSKVSVSEGDWSFDIVTENSGDETISYSIITYYSGKSDAIVIVPSVLGGAPVTEIASQAFGHHSEIMAVYVPDSVTDIDDWAFYDLNTAELISFANPDVNIDGDAFQSSGNAILFLPAETLQSKAGGKSVVSDDTEIIEVAVENSEAAAIAGETYLNVIVSDYQITREMIAEIAFGQDSEPEVSSDFSKVVFSGEAYVAEEQVVEINEAFQGILSEEMLNKTFYGLTDETAAILNETIANDASYSDLKSILSFDAGYYLNGNKVSLNADLEAYDVKTGEVITPDSDTGLYPSTGSGYYKYVAYLDEDDDGEIDQLYYSPYNISYAYNTVSIASDNENLDGLSARDILSTVYLSFANAVITADGADDQQIIDSLDADTSTDGDVIGAETNEERSILWANNYGTIDAGTVHAISTAVGNWAKMSYETGLSSYNVEIVMEWGMNALLYATNGGTINVGDADGERSTFYANGDGANGIIAGGTGIDAGSDTAASETANVSVVNATFTLEGWNNHVADVVYGGYAYLGDVDATTGINGSYAVGQASALANDFGNGVVDVEDFQTEVYGNRSAGAYVIGGGVITASDSSFVSKADAGVVSASGGTFIMSDTDITGQMAFRNRGGINTESTSTFTNVNFTAEKDLDMYVTGDTASDAMNAWVEATGSTSLMHYLMSDATMTFGELCDNYEISDIDKNVLYETLSSVSGESYTDETPLRGSVLDNTFYNYSAGAYTGSTDFAEVPYLTVGSAYGGLVSSVFEFESAGINLKLELSTFSNTNSEDYNYLIASEAGSAPVITFKDSDSSGIIWNEGDVTRTVEGMSSERSSSLEVIFSDSDFIGTFADGSNGLWEVSGLSYENGLGVRSALNGNYYGAKANWSISATFEGDSIWTVTSDAYLGKLVISDEAQLTAPDGSSLEMTVDGVTTDISQGTYEGEIVISVIQN